MPLKSKTQEWTRDFRDFVALLNKHRVKYVLVGGYAVGWHGHPRMTKDVDFFVERSADNAARLVQVLADFGMQSLGFTQDDFLEEGTCIYFGHPPYRIDLLNAADGITFDEAWGTRIQGEREGEKLFVLSREMLLRNKRAAGRDQDRADISALERRAPEKR